MPTDDCRPAAGSDLLPGDCGRVVGVLSEQLAQTNQQIERAVGDVCRSFLSIGTRSREASDRTAEAAGGGDGPGAAMAAAVGTIERLLGRMADADGRAAVTAGHVRRIEAIAAQVGAIEEQLAEIDRISFGLRILALNAKIEAARAGDQGAAFGVVAAATADISRQTVDVVRGVRGATEALAFDVREGTRVIAAALAADQADASVGREEAEGAVRQLRESHGRMQGAVAAAAETSAGLAADISSALTSLQFQDAVRQQIEHILDGLADVRRALPAGGADDDGWAGRLAARLTMGSERAVLGRALGAAGPTPAAEAGSVELF